MERRGAVWLVFWALLVGAFLSHFLFGGAFSAAEIWAALLRGPGDEPAQAVAYGLRLPRACAAALVGAQLACVGAAFQALFRNPLADPYVVGVSSGAAVGGAAASLLGLAGAFLGFGTFAPAFLTALMGLGVVVALSRRGGRIAVSDLLLAGVAVGSFLWALVTFLLAWSGQDAGRILFWLLGSFVSISWQPVAMLGTVGLIGFLFLWKSADALTVYVSGEESAQSLGVETEKLKWSVLLAGSAMAAAAVSAVGIIGFVGLFTPHIARRLVGSKLGRLLPASLLLGASGMLVSDLLAQRLIPGQEINVGVITALAGAPFLIILLKRARP